MTRVVVAPVGGVSIVHDSEFELRTEPWMVEQWSGSRDAEPPVMVHHQVGATSPNGARMVYDGAPWSTYFIDATGRQLVHFAEAGPQCPEQLLVSVQPGYSYELHYAEPPRVPVMQSARDLPILTLALAARANALLVHACAFLLSNDRGVLCPGVSGSGKSTLAKLLMKSAARVELLSDDRVVLTARSGELRIWGTPWPGDAFASSGRDGALGAVVFFARGKTRMLRSLRPTDASRRLFSVVGLPFWDRTMVEQALSIVDRVVGTVPLFEATYEPSGASAEWLVNALEQEL